MITSLPAEIVGNIVIYLYNLLHFYIFYLEDGAADIRGAAVSCQLKHQLLQEVCDDCRREELPALSKDLTDPQGGIGAYSGVGVFEKALRMTHRWFIILIFFTILSFFKVKKYLSGFRVSHHCCVQLLLNGLIYVLVALIRVVDREGLSKKQSGVCAHLKVCSLRESNRKHIRQE